LQGADPSGQGGRRRVRPGASALLPGRRLQPRGAGRIRRRAPSRVAGGVSGETPQKRGWFRTFCRVCEWTSLGVLLLAAAGVYLFYNELRPKVIFALRRASDQAIPVRK